MINKAISHPTESVGRNMDFYSIYTTIDIVPTGDYRDNAQVAYDTMVNLVSFRAQPIINGIPYYVDDLSIEGADELSGAGYVWKFAVEHAEIFAKHNTEFEIVDDVFHLKNVFEDVEINDDVIFIDGSEQNIEFKRFESL